MSQEFTDIASRTRFLHVRQDYDGQNHEDDSGLPLGGHCPRGTHCNPHGTSMLGMVASKNLGIAKKVNPVVVRVPRKKQGGRGYSAQDFLDGVSKVNDVFTDDSGKTRAILSLSWYYDQALFASEVDHFTGTGFYLWKAQLHRLLKNLIRKGVFVVTGSGNKADVC